MRLAKHADWVGLSLSIITHPSMKENVDGILKKRSERYFARVLRMREYYKCTPEGREAFAVS